MKDYSKIKIEQNVPLADSGGFIGLLRQLKVGDSFVMEGTARQSSLSGYGSKLNIKLVSRKQPDGSVRIWRVG